MSSGTFHMVDVESDTASANRSDPTLYVMLCMFIYIYICVHIYIYIYIFRKTLLYIYIYIHRERERERERERKRERAHRIESMPHWRIEPIKSIESCMFNHSLFHLVDVNMVLWGRRAPIA
jgi:Ca2+/Na+ antiporter